jgi:hypothetical protein
MLLIGNTAVWAAAACGCTAFRYITRLQFFDKFNSDGYVVARGRKEQQMPILTGAHSCAEDKTSMRARK